MLKDLLTSIERYLDSTTVHGFKYVQKGNHWILRILWVSIWHESMALVEKTHFTFTIS